MKNLTLHKWVIEIISALLILLFVYTGLSKLEEHNRFRLVLAQSPLIGQIANLLSWLLPIAELLTALLLFLHFTRKWGLIISLLLMILFTGYVAYMIFFTPSLPCSCGGVLKQMTWTQHLEFNIFFTVLTIVGLALYTKHKLFIAINRHSRIPV